MGASARPVRIDPGSSKQEGDPDESREHRRPERCDAEDHEADRPDHRSPGKSERGQRGLLRLYSDAAGESQS